MMHLFVGMLLGILVGLAVGSACASLAWAKAEIRRLMPIECWRLQGFTTEQFRKVEAAGLSDAQLYKQAGNAVTVNVVEALARNLLKFDKDMNESKDIRI